MFVRKRLDIGWTDLLFAGILSFAPLDRSVTERKVARRWSANGDAITFLSVRSGFDALLSALALPEGSEVLVSAITIPHMVEILRAHKLVAQPVDLDMERLAVLGDELTAAVTTSTRAVLVAHLFGSRMPMEPVVEVARRFDLVVIEDCAQAFEGPGYVGHEGSDVSMFSFGIIKTATALGGAILRVRDPVLRARLRSIQDGYPLQRRRTFLARVAKVAMLKAISGPNGFGALALALRRLGRDIDSVVLRSTRGFVGADLVRKIRMRPSVAQLALLERRLRRFDPGSIARRRALAESFAAMLPEHLDRPGRLARDHSHWLFPIVAVEPDAVVEHLAEAGFDATRGGSILHVVGPLDRPEHPACRAHDVMSRVVYLPVHEGLSRPSRVQLAEAVRASAGDRAVRK